MSASDERKRTAFVATILRSTLLQQPNETNVRFESFFAGGKHAFLFGGPSLKWWYTHHREKSEKALAKMLIAETRLSSLTIDSCIGSIRDALRETCINPKYFNQTSVLMGNSKSLLECISTPILEFSAQFYGMLIQMCQQSVCARLLVVPLMPRLTGMSFFLDSQGVGLISGADGETWLKLFGTTFPAASWDSTALCFRGAKEVFGKVKFAYLGIAITSGTKDWCLNSSTSKLRVLLAVIVAYFLENRGVTLETVIAQPSRDWIQFPDMHSTESWCASQSDAILPYFGFERDVDEAALGGVTRWFELLGATSEDIQDRVNKCAYYANLAINADGLVKFIFYYVALDALFGKPMNVERLVNSGISALVPELANRASSLFDLRNELVHGGSRSVTEWKEYERYKDHFGTEPLLDIEEIGLKCLLRFPGAPI